MQSQEYVDPKASFLLKLVSMVDSVNWNIAMGKYQTANNILGSLLAAITVDGEETEDLAKLQEMAVYDFDKFYNVRDKEVRVRQFQVSQYLNRTYFKDFKIAKPLQRKIPHLGVGE
jgi:hypothetical protein